MSSEPFGTAFEFRVSDSMAVPLRGRLLRLKLAGGSPSEKAIAIGQRVRVTAPSGRDRVVTILDHAIIGGQNSRARMERTRELDVVIPFDEAAVDGVPIGIGWSVSGPVTR
jgi:hypothetical protein